MFFSGKNEQKTVTCGHLGSRSHTGWTRNSRGGREETPLNLCPWAGAAFGQVCGREMSSETNWPRVKARKATESMNSESP